MSESWIGLHVKCVLRNSMVLEGIAEEWSDSRVVLRSLDGESRMILPKPADDILMIKVFLQPSEEEKKVIEPTEAKEKVKEKLHEALSSDDPELQQKSVGELRNLVHEQERQIIAQKRREHFGSAGNAKMTQYSNPYVPRVHPRSNTARSAYTPGKLPNWAYGRPPKGNNGTD